MPTMVYRWNQALTRAERDAYFAAVLDGPVPAEPPGPAADPEPPAFLHFWPDELPDYLQAVVTSADQPVRV